jgi:hypothetical protein
VVGYLAIIPMDWRRVCCRGCMKNLILSCLAAVGLLSFVGCSSDDKHTETTTQSASMQTDTKDMHK